MSLIHILLADPHEITREGYMSVLRQSLPQVHFGQVCSFDEASEACRNQAWNLIIMEAILPDGDGVDFMARLSQLEHPPRVLISTSQDESRHGLRFIQSGAAGFISKAAGVEDLVKGVESILDGRNYVSPVLAQHLVHYVKPQSQVSSEELLSEREFAVMVKLAEGYAIKDIASLMRLSSKTVSTYRARLMQKLNLKSLAEIVRYCLDNNIPTNRPSAKRIAE